MDPVYKDTDVELLAEDPPCKVEWHRGFLLSVNVVIQHPDYRGRKYIELAKELALDDMLNPLILGNAVETQRFDPQDVKKVWHYLARFGDLNRNAEPDASLNADKARE